MPVRHSGAIRPMLQPNSVSSKVIRYRVVVIDDHTAILEMMVPIIESLAGFKVVGQLADADEAVTFCRREQPDLIIVDWIMPRVSGPALLQDLRRACPRAHTMVFSGNLWPAAIRAALAAGAIGVVDKMAVLEVFRAAIRKVAAGGVYFSPLVSEQIKLIVARHTQASAKSPDLSGREKAVLRYIAEGFSSKEIAGFLGISAYTVVNHRTSLMRKVGLRRAAQLSLYAAQMGLIGSGLLPATNGGERDPAQR